MRPVARNKKVALNKPFQIKLVEVCYPGAHRMEIKGKWVYVLNGQGNPVLVDEIFVQGPGRWLRLKPQYRAKFANLELAKDVALPMPPGGYTPTDPKLYNEPFYFYLSPHRLGKDAIDRMKRWTKADEADRKDIQEEFKANRDQAILKTCTDAVSGQFNPKWSVVWQDSTSYQPKGYTSVEYPFTTVRAAFNFDQQGNRVKDAFGFQGADLWSHAVLLQDPEAWVLDIHEFGVMHALGMLRDYQADRNRFKMRFIANSIAGEIEEDAHRSEKRDIAGELYQFPPTWSQRAQDRIAVDEELRKRLGWKRCFVDEQITLGPAERPVRVRHKVEVPYELWAAECYSRNMASLYLNLDDRRAEAYQQNVERWALIERSYLESQRFAVLCAAHTYATCQAHAPQDDAKASSEQKGATSTAVRGVVAWMGILEGLQLCGSGRKLIQDLTAAAQNNSLTEDDRFYYSLPRGMTPQGSFAFWSKKFWDTTAKRTMKVHNTFISSLLGGYLDGSYDPEKVKRVARVREWIRKYFSKLAGHTDEKVMHANFKEMMDVLKGKVKPADLSAEQSLAKHYGEVYKQSFKVFTLHVDAGLAVIDGLFSVANLLMGQSKDPKRQIRDLLYVSEAAAKTALVHVTRRQGKLTVEAAEQILLKLKKAGKVAEFAGRFLGCAGAIMDVAFSVESLVKERHACAKLGYLAQSAGAGTTVIGSVYALAYGASLTGPLGWALGGVYLLGYVGGQILIWIYSTSSWQKATANSFLGKNWSGPAALADLDAQFKTWASLYASFEAVLDRDLHLVIKPESLAKDDEFDIAAAVSKGKDFTGKTDWRQLGSAKMRIWEKNSIKLVPQPCPLLDIYTTKLNNRGWTSEIDLRLRGIRSQETGPVKVSIKYRSPSLGITLPRKDRRLELILGMTKEAFMVREPKVSEICDYET